MKKQLDIACKELRARILNPYAVQRYMDKDKYYQRLWKEALVTGRIKAKKQ